MRTSRCPSLVQEVERRKHVASELNKEQKDLALLHEISEQHELGQAALHERLRIMQDIHNGLDSQLISSLALSERGNLNPVQISLLLRD